MSKTAEPIDVVPSGFGEISKRVGLHAPRSRQSTPKTSRSRAETSRTKSKRVVPMGPTPERLAKGDVLKTGGVHRSIPPVERLRDQGKLDHDAKANQMMFEAAEKLKRHFIGAQLIGIKAQNLDRVPGGASENAEEVCAHHRKVYAQARTLMGWSEENRHRGCARIVLAVVCEEMPVTEAAAHFTGEGRKDRAQAVAMDRLRQGLFTLACHWRLL